MIVSAPPSSFSGHQSLKMRAKSVCHVLESYLRTDRMFRTHPSASASLLRDRTCTHRSTVLISQPGAPFSQGQTPSFTGRYHVTETHDVTTSFILSSKNCEHSTGLRTGVSYVPRTTQTKLKLKYPLNFPLPRPFLRIL